MISMQFKSLFKSNLILIFKNASFDWSAAGDTVCFEFKFRNLWLRDNAVCYLQKLFLNHKQAIFRENVP